MYSTNEFMSSSERLVSFLDGELGQEETGTLFYDLAQNPDLQDEMRQYVQLRNTLRNSKIEPPAYLKSKLLESTGLKEGPVSTFMDVSSKATAMLIAMFFNRTSLSVLLLSFMSIGAILMLNNSTDEPAATNLKNLNTASVNQTVQKVPFTESYSGSGETANSSSGLTEEGNSTGNSKNGTYSSIESKKVKRFNRGNSSNFSSSTEQQSFSQNSPAENLISENEQVWYDISPSRLNSDHIDFGNISNHFNKQRITAVSNFLSVIMDNSTIYFKKFGAASYPNFNLANESNPLMNNLSIGIKYSISTDHSIGLAGGIENFLMTFDKEVDDIIYRYNQSWNGGWLAVTYQYNLGEIAESGFRTEFNLLAGSTVVGPIFKTGLGVNYSITENLYINFGVEGGMLIYNEKQADGGRLWFTTEKVGYSFGFGIGL